MTWPFVGTEQRPREVSASSLAALLLAVALAGCGWIDPTGPDAVDEVWRGEVAAHGWVCASDIMVYRSDFRAHVEPTVLTLELWRGYCNLSTDGGHSGELVAASATGTLKLTLPSGGYFLRVGNPTDAAVTYSVEVQYLSPTE